ncbi:hypothetical protein [Actinoplanes sp. NPDC051494]|uniref:hypothetical protein n=1 Tax=Actinoplanes sp. NPDC051494 TaxID=3363907 RepID=UPI0037BA6EBB
MPDQPADRHVRKRRPIGLDDEDWKELGAVVGDKQRSELVRQLVRAFLKRPGVKIPRRKDYEPSV